MEETWEAELLLAADDEAGALEVGALELDAPAELLDPEAVLEEPPALALRQLLEADIRRVLAGVVELNNEDTYAQG